MVAAATLGDPIKLPANYRSDPEFESLSKISQRILDIIAETETRLRVAISYQFATDEQLRSHVGCSLTLKSYSAAIWLDEVSVRIKNPAAGVVTLRLIARSPRVSPEWTQYEIAAWHRDPTPEEIANQQAARERILSEVGHFD